VSAARPGAHGRTRLRQRRTVRTCPLTTRSCSLNDVVEQAVRPTAPDDVVREGNVVLVGEARRAGDSILLARRSGSDDRRGDELDAPPLRLSKFHAPEIVFGPDSLPEAAHAAVRLGARRPFVVTDGGLTEAGWPAELLVQLRAAGLTPVVWTDVTPNPKDHEIEAGYQRYAEAGCDVVLGIGGGSVIDAAKGIALLAANGGRILDYEGIDKIEHPIPPLIMMPSTSGTGADVSQFCVVTDTE
jgi:alcohol dehydrogenase